jgi:hypothetical protein
MRKVFKWLYVTFTSRAVRAWLNSVKANFFINVMNRPRGRSYKEFGRGNGNKMNEGMKMVEGRLAMRVIRKNGDIEHYHPETGERLEGANTVTDAGVAFLVDDWDDNTTDITTMNYHAMGTGGSPPGTPAVTVTTLVTEVESRVAGTKSQPAANQIRSVATITATASRAINEWGLLSASSGGTLWSSRWFTVINLNTDDAIEFTYTLTITSFTA